MVEDNAQFSTSISDVYGRPLTNLATRLGRRQQFGEFRVIRHDEEGVTFMALDGTIKEHSPRATYRFGGPRLTVVTRPNRRFVYTETGEEAIPNVGQPYTDANGNIAFGMAGMTQRFPILVYRAEDVA